MRIRTSTSPGPIEGVGTSSTFSTSVGSPNSSNLMLLITASFVGDRRSADVHLSTSRAQVPTLDLVGHELKRTVVRNLCLGQAAQAAQKIGPRGVGQVVVIEGSRQKKIVDQR